MESHITIIGGQIDSSTVESLIGRTHRTAAGESAIDFRSDIVSGNFDSVVERQRGPINHRSMGKVWSQQRRDIVHRCQQSVATRLNQTDRSLQSKIKWIHRQVSGL